MDPRSYYLALNTAGRRRYAKRAGVALSYLRVNVFPAGQEAPRQNIGLRTVVALADASEGLVGRTEALEWAADICYPEPQRVDRALRAAATRAADVAPEEDLSASAA